MKNKTHRLNGLIDAALLTGFVLACLLDLTGREAHQWLGLVIGGLALYHLWRHQAWVRAASRRWLSGLASRARLYTLVDLGLFAGLGGIISTGIVISSWLNLPLSHYAVWRGWHVGITLATLGLLAAKLGLHWRWIAQILRPPSRTPASTGASATAVGRRDFLKVMGGVSVATLLAAAGVVSSQVASAASGAAQPRPLPSPLLPPAVSRPPLAKCNATGAVRTQAVAAAMSTRTRTDVAIGASAAKP